MHCVLLPSDTQPPPLNACKLLSQLQLSAFGCQSAHDAP